MKPLPAIAAASIAMALLLVPMVSVAAGTISFTSPAAGSSFKDSQAYTISGTISPAPTQPDQVFITVKNPSGSTVDSASATVTSGAFSYSTAVGGSSAWVAGTYTITAQDTFGATGSTTFSYTVAPPFNTTQWILNIARNQTIIEHQLTNIQGNLTAMKASEAAEQKNNAGNFSAITSALSTLSGSMTQLSSSVSAIQNSLTSLASTVGTINTNVNGLSSGIGNAVTQATNAANNASSAQTYVLVVAVLAAITLVLELAILVRKLS